MTRGTREMQIALLAFMLLVGAVPILAAATDPESTPEISLTDQLVRRFGDLSLAERRLVAATELGVTADCTGLSGDNKNIRGDLLAWLCANPQAAAQVTYRGVSVVDARIVKEVDLQWARIPFPITARNCTFEEKIDVSNSHIVDLNLAGSTVTYLAPVRLPSRSCPIPVAY